MPTKVGIHVFPCCPQQRRGWRAFARHDDGRRGSRTGTVGSHRRPCSHPCRAVRWWLWSGISGS